jgi:hypothetical protein
MALSLLVLACDPQKAGGAESGVPPDSEDTGEPEESAKPEETGDSWETADASETGEPVETADPDADADGDGVRAAEDCDDADPDRWISDTAAGDRVAGFSEFCVHACTRGLEGTLRLSNATQEEIATLGCLVYVGGERGDGREPRRRGPDGARRAGLGRRGCRAPGRRGARDTSWAQGADIGRRCPR